MNNPHIIHKNNEYWIFSSKAALLDCMPQYKVKSIEQVRYLIKLMER